MIELNIDFPSENADDAEVRSYKQVVAMCRAFTWKYGPVNVNIATTHQGPMAWAQGWEAQQISDNHVIIILTETHVVSALWYRYAINAITQYYIHEHDTQVMGIGLNLAAGVLGETATQPWRAIGSVTRMFVTSHLPPASPRASVYGYQLISSTSTVIFPRHWRMFLSWLHDRDLSYIDGSSRTFEPCIPTLLCNHWWAKKPPSQTGQWLLRFVHEYVSMETPTHIPQRGKAGTESATTCGSH